MFKRLALVIVALFAVASLVNAQDPPDPAFIRVMQLTYGQHAEDADVSISADVRVDNAPVFRDVAFPFTTDYATVAPTTLVVSTHLHRNTLMEDAVQMTTESGHRYSVIAYGDYSEGVTYTVVDETDIPLAETTSAVALVNLTPASVDVYIDDERVVADLGTGEHAFASLPLAQYTARVTPHDDPETELYTADGAPLPNTALLAVAIGAAPDEISVILHYSSELTVAEYLRGQGNNSLLSTAAGLIEDVDLLGDLDDEGPFTLFLPADEAIDALPEGSLPADETVLATLLARHVVAENLPPYELMGTATLTTLNGAEVRIAYADTESGYWEIEGAPILWDIRLANGVIYVIEGVIPPPE